jgi:endonuclease/exonuclease/phosphatase family metal-dependent hydrolase
MGDTEPVILVGDFNALSAATEFQPLQTSCTDAWASSGHGRGDGAAFPAEAPAERIDDICTTGAVKPLLTRVVHADPTASDHLPLVGKVVVAPLIRRRVPAGR